MSHPISRRPIDAALARAGSLTDKLDPVSATERAEACRELQDFLATVPPSVAFTGTRRLMLIYLLLAVFGAAFASFIVLKTNGSLRLPVILGVASLALFVMAWFQRHATRTVFMTLDHQHLHVPNLSGPLDLLDVTGVTFVDTRQFKPLLFALRDGANPPTHRRALALGVGHALVTPGQLRVTSGGYAVDGKSLDGDEVLAIVDTYLRAAQAHQQLAALQD